MANVKPNCYNCIHRREVPGSSHSSCANPATESTRQSAFMKLAGVVGKRGGPELAGFASAFHEGPERAAAQLNIKAVEHGVRHGWFVWPVNFDPLWLEHCDGFQAKAEG